MQGLTCGVLLAFAPSSILLVVALFAPVLAVLVTDATPTRQMTKTAILFDFSVGLHALTTVWMSDQPLAETIIALHRPVVLLGSWGAVAFAWLGIEVAGLASRLVLEARNTVHQNAIRESIAALEAEWGLAEPAPPA